MQKLKNDLYLQGNKVISYETVVATIKDGYLIEKGKFSNTTSKHISYVAQLLGLQIVRSNKRPSFDKLPYGANF